MRPKFDKEPGFVEVFKPVELRHCPKCGCLYSGPCEKHETVGVPLRPGREGLIIG